MRDGTLTELKDGGATLSRERLNACLEAAYELEALANILPGVVLDVAEADGAHYAVRGIAHRIRDLSRMVIGGLTDHAETVLTLETGLFTHPRREAA